jgi:hypothetical protein
MPSWCVLGGRCSALESRSLAPRVRRALVPTVRVERYPIERARGKAPRVRGLQPPRMGQRPPAQSKRDRNLLSLPILFLSLSPEVAHTHRHSAGFVDRPSCGAGRGE